MCVRWFNGDKQVAIDGSPWTKDREARARFSHARFIKGPDGDVLGQDGKRIKNPARVCAIAEAQMTMLGEGHVSS